MTTFTLRFSLILLGFFALVSYGNQLPLELPSSLTDNPLTSGDQEKISALKASEWLGPLAPIAISPFFGITILAGISQFGADYLPANAFVSDNPVLANPAVFWVFLGLTILTSLPRFTKVSKPAAQAIDQLEAYAGIVTIVLIRILSSIPEAEPASANTAMVVEMGVLTFSADVLFSLAAVINIIVINTVKFFFEVMVWLIPFPFVDAALEVANKSLCAGLMAVYAWSPVSAAILNLLLFTICLLVFRWVNRRVSYARSVLCDPIWSMINKRFGVPKRKSLVVFPRSGIGPFPAKSRLILQPTDDGWQLVQSRMLLQPKTMKLLRGEYQLAIQSGMILNSIQLSGEESDQLLFSKRYSKHMDELAKLINVEQSAEMLQIDLRGDLVVKTGGGLNA